jgi:phage protein D
LISAQPAGRGLEFWAQQEKLELEFLIGFPANPDAFQRTELTSFLVGYADDITVDLEGDTITLAGRDLTSKLIDFKRTIVFASGNLIASDIVRQIAVAQGLTPVVTSTSAAVGGYYQIVKALVASDVSYWDIVTRLAQIEGFRAYVKGHELHFEPRPGADADAYVIRWQPAAAGVPVSNVQRLTFSRNLSLAKDLRVRVISFDAKTKKVVNQTADRKRVYNKTTSKAVPYGGAAQEYVYHIPGRTPAQAQAIAQAKLTELSQHEMNVSADLPGDALLTADTSVQVIGTGSAFDQTYFVSSITRAISFENGYRMVLQAKNQTPNNPV